MVALLFLDLHHRLLRANRERPIEGIRATHHPCVQLEQYVEFNRPLLTAPQYNDYLVPQVQIQGQIDLSESSRQGRFLMLSLEGQPIGYRLEFTDKAGALVVESSNREMEVAIQSALARGIGGEVRG